MNVYAKRLQALRDLMKNRGVDVYVILSCDPHLCEYCLEHYKTREWLSGFSGSMGNLIIAQDEAYLWADGRYWLQAQRELEGSGITLQKMNASNTMMSWLLQMKQGQVLATNGHVLPLNLFQEWKHKLSHLKIKTDEDLIDELWRENRPSIPTNAIFEHPISFALIHPKEKIAKVQEAMRKLGVTHHLISALEDIAWITNLRGADIAYNPLFLSYLLLDLTGAILFVDEYKLSNQIRKKLQKNGISIQSYESINDTLSKLQAQSLLLDPSKTTMAIFDALNPHIQIIEDTNPSTHLKARKSQGEISHIQEAMKQDGVALCKFFSWLTENAPSQYLSELDIATKLMSLRQEHSLYYTDSFEVIAGFNANGALPHYKANKDHFSYLDTDGLLLLDSGAHYLNGTTDITRVVPIGKINQAQKRDYTLVLKAHIAISSAIFPQGIYMPLLDPIARSVLWKEGLDYNHGTGHGVGYFLNVHEGPQVLSYYAKPEEKTRCREGMVISIEPGIYREGKWGVRLENLVVLQSRGEGFLGFENLTLCPFEIDCILGHLLTPQEKEWLNVYHQKVWHSLSPLLQDDLKTLLWLQERTKEVE